MTGHNELQNMVKEFLEWSRWYVWSNVEGKSKAGRHTTPGITDLTAIKAGVVLWIEIKVDGDSLRPSQEKFRDSVLSKGGHWIECHDNMNSLILYIDTLRKQGIKV